MVTDSLELTGTTQAIHTVHLVARVAGYLEKVLFQDGQIVRKGQPLFVIQRSQYEDGLRQAEASILQYRAQLEYDQRSGPPLRCAAVRGHRHQVRRRPGAADRAIARRRPGGPEPADLQ
jgi:multidrug efflux pump subunit AcrA (membrane-fusion protein)